MRRFGESIRWTGFHGSRRILPGPCNNLRMPSLFAYGTLQPGLVPAELASPMAGISLIARGSVPGILYDLGGYPGAILDPRAKSRIHGVIYELPDDPQFLAQLDAYEEYDPAAPDASLFRRALHPVTLANGDHIDCWIYVYNRDPGAAPIVPDGVFPPRA